MKIKTPKRKNTVKVILILLVTVVLTAIGVFCYLTFFVTPKDKTNTESNQLQQTGDVDYGPATDEQIKAGVDQKNQTPTDNNPTTGDITINITSLNASSNFFQLRTELNLLTNTGTCTLTLKKGISTIIKESGIQAGPSTSTCKGFDLNEPLSTGKWTADISVVSGDRRGTTSQEFTVK